MGNLSRIGIVISTLGLRSELYQLIEYCLDQGLIVSIADQSTHGINLPIMNKNNARLFINRMKIKGAAIGRNTAILNLPPEVEYAFTLNDCSIPEISFIRQSVQLFDTFSDVSAIGGIYKYKSGKKTFGRFGFLYGSSISSLIEPGMILRLKDLNKLEAFNPKMGPGSKSMLQAGEGLDLLYRLQRERKKILMLNSIASVDSRENPLHSVLVDFKYGFGFGVIHSYYGFKRYVFVRVLTPLFRHFLGIPKGDSPYGILNLISVCLGRFLSLFIPKFISRRLWFSK